MRWGTSGTAKELGWEMLGGMCAKAGAFVRAIIQFAMLAGLSCLGGALPVYADRVVTPLAASTVPTCENTTEEIVVCGKTETITHLCSFPFVTGPMAAEVPNYPILKQEEERHNACVADAADCKAKDSEKGDGLARKLEDDAAHDIPSMIRFHMSVTGRHTDKDFKGIRDDAAMVTRTGFTRDILAHEHLYRHLDDQKFHEDAEGIALANKALLDKELEELEKLSTALGEMKQKFKQVKDFFSERNTEGYEIIAHTRSMQLKAVSCELKRMSDKDRRIENRISKVIVEGDELSKDKYGQGSPDAPSPNSVSDITGIDPDPVLPDPKVPELKIGTPLKLPVHLSPVENGGAGLPVAPNSTGGSMPFPAAPADDPLEPFGPDPAQVGKLFRETASAPQGLSEEDDGLFDRVRRQYRAREQQGNFRQSLVD